MTLASTALPNLWSNEAKTGAQRRSGSGLDRLKVLVEGRVEPPPVAKLLGFDLEQVEHGRTVVTMVAGPQHANPMGTLHGGILGDLADAAMGMAYGSTLAEGETFSTVELKLNFLRPFWTGKLTAVGTVVGGGKTIGLTEARITDEKGRLIAHATSTCMTLRGEKAAGR